MKEVRKKSMDAATNELLIAASKTNTDVIWDRAEAAQPQCGFGRLSICCADCLEGPCRVNPFAVVPELTVCGRTRAELVSHRLLARVTDGAVALAGLAREFGADVEGGVAEAIYMTNDGMLAPADDMVRMVEVGETAAKLLLSIRAAKERVIGKAEPGAVAANMGALRADATNVVLMGHVAPRIVEAFRKAASKAGVPFNLASICGAEAGARLPVLTNYDSQEMPLLTGAVDLLVLGPQCVMPATVALAKARNTAVMAASSLDTDWKILEAVGVAARAFEGRRGKRVQIPPATEQLHTGYTAENCKPVFKALKDASARSLVKGIVYLGGCGTVANTQDAQMVQMAAGLLSEGYLVVTAGCAGAALAKAGMCRPEYAAREGLKGTAEIGVPAVLHLGSCHDAGEFLVMAQEARELGILVFAVFPEIGRNKIWATAVAFAAKGIRTYVDAGEAGSLPEMKLPGELLPLSELENFIAKSTKVATAK
jgi:hydroxylamine reductase (hybrid-cluster protein)